MVLKLKRLIWDEKNLSHIAKHSITISEVNEVFSRYHLVEPTKQKRKVITGETDDGRIIEVPVTGKGKRRYYPLTAHDASPKQAQIYLSAKTKREGVNQRDS